MVRELVITNSNDKKIIIGIRVYLNLSNNSQIRDYIRSQSSDSRREIGIFFRLQNSAHMSYYTLKKSDKMFQPEICEK